MASAIGFYLHNQWFRKVLMLCDDVSTEEHPSVPFLQGAESLADLLADHAVVEGCGDVPFDYEIELLCLF